MLLVDGKRRRPVVLLAAFSSPVIAQVTPYAVNDGNMPDASAYRGGLFDHYPSPIVSHGR